MTTRRWSALIAALTIFALTVDWSPDIPPFPPDAVSQARAQLPMISQGLVHATVASVNAANTTSEVLLYQYPIPAALIASWTSNNTAFGAAPLHLRLNGLLRTAGGNGLGGNGAPLTLSVNLGGTGATMTVINGVTLPSDIGSATSCGSGAAMGIGACYAPWSLDVVFSPIATLTTFNCTDVRPCNQSLFMAGKFTTVGTFSAQNGYASDTTYNAATLGTINVLTSQTLNVVARWASASSANVLNVYNGALKIGF